MYPLPEMLRHLDRVTPLSPVERLLPDLGAFRGAGDAESGG